MTIAIGDRLPEATFRVLGSDGIETVTSCKVFYVPQRKKT